MKWKLDKPKALPMRHIGNPKNEYSWEDWREETKAKYPIRYFFQETLPHLYRVKIYSYVSHFLYWLRTHTYNRYHILDLRNPEYKWGWCNRRNTIMYAVFNTVIDFVDKEEAFNCHVDWSFDQKHRKAKKQILLVYNWWKKDRWKLEKKKNRIYAKTKSVDLFKKIDYKRYNKYKAIDDLIDKTDNKMLEIAIKYRSYMWT